MPDTCVWTAWPRRGDPLCGGLALGADLGLLGIEPATRRRNRMNGTVVVLDEAGFEVRVDQSFGNCPQYIQARSPRWVERAPAEPVELGPRLDAAAGRLIARADTLFIASAAPGAGADVSHRGGRPGFIHVEIDQDRTVLTFPDFRGNFFFNTLGNLVAHPKAGLLFVDYATGDVLQVTGRATIVASGPEVEAFAGAQRMVRIEVDAGVWWAQVHAVHVVRARAGVAAGGHRALVTADARPPSTLQWRHGNPRDPEDG
jgi:predicted pyridoxine 5'-phosphate oxidase superfamily flavin-nucleotide-binding protein